MKPKIAIYPMSSVKAIYASITINSGSWQEEGESWGAFHLLEHLAFDGTQAFPTHKKMSVFKENYGIKANATTGGRHTNYWLKFPEGSTDQGFKVLKELVFNMLVNEKEVKREVNVVSQEFKDKWSNPENRFWRTERMALVGKNHQYIRDGLGQPKYINTFSRDDLLDMHKRYYVKPNISVVVVGKITKKHALEKISYLLDGVPSTPPPSAKITKPDMNSGYLWHKEDTKKTAISLSWEIPGYKNTSYEQIAPLIMLRYILGVSSNSRLYNTLRVKHGIVYSVRASTNLFPNFGIFNISADTSPKKAKLAMELMLKEFHKIVEKGITQTELNRANKYLTLSEQMSYDSVSGIGDRFEGMLTTHGKVYTSKEIEKIFSSLKLADIVETANKFIKNPNNPFIATMSQKNPELV